MKYLPPITSWFTAFPLVSVPVPIYKRSPPLEPLSARDEYANSPCPSVDGLPEVPDLLILNIDAISIGLR